LEAAQMTLAVCGREDLDTLQRLVVELFSEVQMHRRSRSAYPLYLTMKVVCRRDPHLAS
jgi:hypothetical protein